MTWCTSSQHDRDNDGNYCCEVESNDWALYLTDIDEKLAINTEDDEIEAFWDGEYQYYYMNYYMISANLSDQHLN